MKLVILLSRLVAGVFALAGILYLVALAANWNDQPPSAAARRFDDLLAARSQVPLEENASAYLLGFSAPADQDPREVGGRRLAWLKSFSSQSDLKSDPLPEPLDLDSGGSPAMVKFVNDCGRDERQRCAEVFATTAAEWQPTEMEALALRRYQALLGHHAWRDVIPSHLSAPLPAFNDILHAQRLYMLRLGTGKNPDAIRDALSADFAFWRGAHLHAETLLAKMISIAALRNHFFYSNLVLRHLPADQVMQAMPPDWQREFSAEERSMHLVMAGEWKFSQSSLRFVEDAGALVDTAMGAYEPTDVGKWLDYLARPLFKPQDTMNGVAERYLFIAEQFAVPMNQYSASELAIKSRYREHPQPISLYNPVGDVYLREVENINNLNYAFRTANLEGMRRAALLMSQLRSRGVAAQDIGAELARAELRDPYTDTPFEWDAQRMAVVFTTPDDHHWRRNEYFY